MYKESWITSSDRSLVGKVVLVGAGAKNLGGLISRTVAADGAKVAVHYHSAVTKSDADATVATVGAAGGEGFAIQGDLSEVADVECLFAAAKDRFGGVDVAVNTAGKVLRKPIVETTGQGGQPAHQDREHRPGREVPCHGRLVDHRPDPLRQRRLHHPLSGAPSRTSRTRPPPGAGRLFTAALRHAILGQSPREHPLFCVHGMRSP
ncbi:SDR family oxidoreductase [Saccharothrix sp. ST-888]|uniref:SDR family oxidoreductase n=1 Tax=Saccharothrix sp. ST-888 TaxID=1427391 RepID=UPI001E593978|nr:SDR family oxidoreductase [Saccharothrix sp. ST-888]